MDNNSLVRAKLERSLELNDLDDVLRDAEVVMLLLDTSGSMEIGVRGGKRRIDALRAVVADIRGKGHVPMIAFGGPYDAQVRFVDVIPEPDGGTPLHVAIPFAKQYGATRIVVVSDGCPDLPDQSMEEAKSFGGRIDVVFIGDEGDGGSFFLDQLAQATGGKRHQGDLSDVKKLASTVIGLLEGAVEPTRAPIQGPGFTTVDEDDVVETEDAEDFEDGDDDDDEEDDE